MSATGAGRVEVLEQHGGHPRLQRDAEPDVEAEDVEERQRRETDVVGAHGAGPG